LENIFEISVELFRRKDKDTSLTGTKGSYDDEENRVEQGNLDSLNMTSSFLLHHLAIVFISIILLQGIEY